MAPAVLPISEPLAEATASTAATGDAMTWGELTRERRAFYEDEGPLCARVAGEMTIVRMLHAPIEGAPSRWVLFSGAMPHTRRREVIAAQS